MNIRRAMPVIATEDPEGSRQVYVGLLGFTVAMEQDGMLMLRSPSVPTTQLLLAWASPTAMDPHVLEVDVSIEVEDVDAAYAAACDRGLEVVYPLTDEPWGVRRFFLREPSGRTLNIASHVADLPG